MTDVEAWATVSRRALSENARIVAERVAPARLAVVVKDDAYAHGLDEVVATLGRTGVSAFAALDVRNGLRVRETARDALVFCWVFGQDDDLGQAIASRLDLGVSSPSLLERVAAAAGRVGATARIHLKIDTGLHRAGIRPEGWDAFVARAAALERERRVRVEGVWTHISETSYESDSASIRLFESGVARARAAGLAPRWRHLAASAAAFERADARFDLVRIGAFVYGIAPGDGIGPAQLGLRPALALSTRVESLPGGGTARLPLGGVHGLYREAGGRVQVAIGGRRRRIVAVDAVSALVEADPSVQRGDEVVLFGDGSHGEASLQEWADAMGTIGEELVIRLARRAHHRYVED